MRAITRRLEALEQASGMYGGWDISKPVHTILLAEAQPYEQALADYMRQHPDKEVRGDHNVMWIVLASPKFDEAGGRIWRDVEQDNKQDGPSLSEVLEQMEAA